MWLLDKFLTKAIKHGQLIVTDHDGKEYTYGPGGEYDPLVGGRAGPIRIKLTNKKAAGHIVRYPQMGRFQDLLGKELHHTARRLPR